MSSKVVDLFSNKNMTPPEKELFHDCLLTAKNNRDEAVKAGKPVPNFEDEVTRVFALKLKEMYR